MLNWFACCGPTKPEPNITNKITHNMTFRWHGKCSLPEFSMDSYMTLCHWIVNNSTTNRYCLALVDLTNITGKIESLNPFTEKTFQTAHHATWVSPKPMKYSNIVLIDWAKKIFYNEQIVDKSRNYHTHDVWFGTDMENNKLIQALKKFLNKRKAILEIIASVRLMRYRFACCFV